MNTFPLASATDLQPLPRAGDAPYPELADLLGRLRFSTHDGRIWLDEQRMLLVQAKALGALRREMIQTLGVDVARGMMTRMGYHAGVQDAQLARRLRASMSPQDAFVVGPQLHCLEGIGHSQLIALEFDLEHGRHYGEFLWTSAIEDEEHARYFPVGTEPACWMQIGYASGFSSEFMGQPVLYREVECLSMGHLACRIVGKSVHEWGDDADARADLRFVMPDLSARSEASATARAPLPADEAPLLGDDAPGAADAPLVGSAPAFRAVWQLIERVAPARTPVLLHGETGTGKGLLARALHRRGAHPQGPLVVVACAALTPAQVASGGLELERARGGTLVLDGVHALNAEAQAALLRALQDVEQERAVAGGAPPPRLIATSTADLQAEVQAGHLRADLFYRLNVFPVRVPPLRERREDIPRLMQHFLRRQQHAQGRTVAGFTLRAADALLSYDWPGNVRELENLVERGVILAPANGLIDIAHLFGGGERTGPLCYSIDAEGRLIERTRMAADSPGHDDSGAADPTGRIARQLEQLLLGDDDTPCPPLALDTVEATLLERAVARTGGNVSAAARLLGLTRAQMVYRLKSHGLASA